MFKYTKAVCRNIPKSIIMNGLRSVQNEKPFDYEVAVKQHERYVEALKQAGVSVTTINADESLPDCVFVEDTTVVIGKKVLITNPGAESRKKEVDDIEKVFRADETMQVKRMISPATLDGGDVMFTGKEILVGLSNRTNIEGFNILKDYFCDYPSHSVHVSKGLHLKSAMSMACDDTIVCSTNPVAVEMLQKAQEKCQFQYKVIHVPDQLCANCVLVNGKLICQPMERFPNSICEFQKLPVQLVELECTEVEKVDGCYTCCSVLY